MISKLQKQNADKIFSYIDSLTTDTPEARVELLGSDSPIESILSEWADETIKALNKSWVDKKFNPNSQSGMFEPHIVDKEGLLTVLTLTSVNPTASYYAEHGRGKGKRPPIAPIENWITYRGIDVHQVKGWTSKYKDSKGHTKTIKPYKNITDTLKLRNVMASAISRSIGKKGTIKRFGYKGSKFISSVVNDQSLAELSRRLSEAVGYTISVSLAKEI
jgi:hypothetical protein